MKTCLRGDKWSYYDAVDERRINRVPLISWELFGDEFLSTTNPLAAGLGDIQYIISPYCPAQI